VSTVEDQKLVLEYLARHRPLELDDTERGQIAATVALVPSDIECALDVGAGDGRISACLADRCRVVAVDYAGPSRGTNDHVRVRGDSSALPFRTASFDLVMCCEVLEHLDDTQLDATVRDLTRVARRYLLVSVPYRERLANSRTRCPRCHAVFHVWGHVRRFSGGSLDSLVPGARLVGSRGHGRRPPLHLEWVQRVDQSLGGRWAAFAPATICGRCGNTARRFDRDPSRA